MLPDQARLESLVLKNLPASGSPNADDLLEMWLYLPVEVNTPNGRMKVRSTLDASLGDCREMTNRDSQGNVRPGASAGSWLGAVGYLTLIDQIGGAVDHLTPARTPSGGNDFERAVAQFSTLSDDEAVCLYALRNSLAHDFSLVNIAPGNGSTSRQQALTRLFTATQGTQDLILRPNGQWNPQNPLSGLATTVDLELLGDEVETMVRNLYTAHAQGNLAIRSTPPVTPAVWGYGSLLRAWRMSSSAPERDQRPSTGST